MPILPLEVLRNRVKNEIGMCERKLKHKIVPEDPELSTFPVRINVIIVDVPGPVLRMGKNRIGHRYTHEFMMEITNEYPWKKPVVRWKTSIFHPNIRMPEDGGYVCTRLLDNWVFSSNLLSFIKGLESLLLNPNPKSPYDTDSCTRAAEYFNKHVYKPPMPVETRMQKPKVIKAEKEE